VNKRLTILLVILVLVPATGILYLLETPRLVSVSPEANARNVTAGSPLRLKFSRRMQAQSVADRLHIDPLQAGTFQWEGSTLVFTPASPWPSGATVTVRLDAGARTAGLLAFSIRQTAAWSFSIGEPRLLYLYPADRAADLYLMNPFSGTKLKVTDSQAGILEYSVNATGTAVFYDVKNGKGGTNLYRLDGLDQMDAGQPLTQTLPGPTLLLDCGQSLCRNPQISPQGDFLAYEKTGLMGGQDPPYPRVWLLPLSEDPSSKPGEPRLAGPPDHQTMQPSWSPSGLLSYYDSSQAAFAIQDPNDGQSVFFPNQTGQPGAWDPSSTYFLAPEISYVTTGQPGNTTGTVIGNSHLMRFNRLDGSVQDLTQLDSLEDVSPAYSPDGKWIALARKYLDAAHWTPGRQLWLMGPDGQNARPLTNDPYYNHYDFSWSPDSKLLVYVRFDETALTQPPEVWMVDVESTKATKLVVGGFSPQWIP
jgi:Bacterial Ig-like domain/WD40-like Beta Propeller Repeat